MRCARRSTRRTRSTRLKIFAIGRWRWSITPALPITSRPSANAARSDCVPSAVPAIGFPDLVSSEVGKFLPRGSVGRRQRHDRLDNQNLLDELRAARQALDRVPDVVMNRGGGYFKRPPGRGAARFDRGIWPVGSTQPQSARRLRRREQRIGPPPRPDPRQRTDRCPRRDARHPRAARPGQGHGEVVAEKALAVDDGAQRSARAA